MLPLLGFFLFFLPLFGGIVAGLLKDIFWAHLISAACCVSPIVIAILFLVVLIGADGDRQIGLSEALAGYGIILVFPLVVHFGARCLCYFISMRLTTPDGAPESRRHDAPIS